MIRPVQFGFNAQTAVNNAFQLESAQEGVHDRALQEFDRFVDLLRNNGVDVVTVDDSTEPHTPDSIFPNNWVSFHDDGRMILFPMYAENRRLERKPAVIDSIRERFVVNNVIDLTGFENNQQFLEGTGSMVLDRDSKIAYACLSPRTDEVLLDQFCRLMHYRKVAFVAVDDQGRPIYHTNVMMCVGDRYVVICLEAIPSLDDRSRVLATIVDSGKEVIDISLAQMNHFAGNMLQVSNTNGEKLLVMSSQAYASLTVAQRQSLEHYNRILHAPLDTIEANGGGSARCMMAEIHLPIRK